jgi:hypothetical protein
MFEECLVVQVVLAHSSGSPTFCLVVIGGSRFAEESGAIKMLAGGHGRVCIMVGDRVVCAALDEDPAVICTRFGGHCLLVLDSTHSVRYNFSE